MSETKWMQSGNQFSIVPSNVSIKEELTPGIYSVRLSQETGYYLTRIGDKFEFDFEVLGLENKFVDHVLKTYHNTSGNFGLLLNGVKGTGKTVTAKVIANKLEQPVILVDSPLPGIDKFLSSLECECVIFFDEFEKCFSVETDLKSGNDHSILTIMDGVYNCCKRKTFILTTNQLKVNDCLLSRPSRIRYLKSFSNISLDVINSLMDTFLKDQSIREELITFVINLSVCSVDIIKALIHEINIHGKEEFDYIKTIFNVTASDIRYNIQIFPNKIRKFESDEDVIINNSNEAFEMLKYCDMLSDKESRSDDENNLLQSFNFNRYFENWVFPCRLYDIKPNSVLKGRYIVTEIDSERRIITVIDQQQGKTKFIYVEPTYNYNPYTRGNMM